MKILILSSFLPYPLFSGGHVRLFNLIKELKNNGHKITLVCEKRSNQTEEDIKELEKICEEVITVSRQKQWSLKNILKTGISKYPFLITGHTQQIIKDKISELIAKKKFDLIHVETFYVMQNLPKVSLPVVLVEHNIEYMVYKRFVNNASLFIKPLFLLDVLKMKIQEEKFWKKADILIAVSEEERKQMNRDDIFIVSNGVDIERFKIPHFAKALRGEQDSRLKNKEKKLLFIGDFKWIQNRDAIAWLLKDIWPKIESGFRNQKLGIKLWIVGRKIPDSIRQLTNDKNIIFDENAPNETSEIFRRADILIAPIRVGGGTSFKILEAMASGVPVITTSLGIEGIDAKKNENVLIADSSDEIANLTLDLIKDETKYKKISENARKLIEEKYDWKIIVKDLEKAYSAALSKK